MGNRVFITDYISEVNERISVLFDERDIEPKLMESMWYSISAGGKRVRPVLNILANKLLDGDLKETLDIACAMEMIHTYSLIHDDLPALDNDKLRRGKLTNHMVFGEAFAILAGDGLLNMAYEVLMANALKYSENIKAHLLATDYIARSVGVSGMISGQCADILSEDIEEDKIDINVVDKIHINKTGKMLTASLMSGALITNPSKEELNAIETFGRKIGLAFQIVDDVLDITGTEKNLGKSVGKDIEAKKMTFPHVYGLDNSIKIADDLVSDAKDALGMFKDKAKDLILLSDYLIKRTN
jgi:geranylgeranyl diphosphate synthase, type II